MISFAVEPKSRGDEEKISTAIQKVIEEDPGLRYARQPQTGQFLLSGQGQMHVEVGVSRLRKRYGVEVRLHPPKVPYLETIRGKADVQGQAQETIRRSRPVWRLQDPRRTAPPGWGLRIRRRNLLEAPFRSSIFPPSKKAFRKPAPRECSLGSRRSISKSPSMTGSFHAVDSSEMAFKIAGRLAFRKAIEQARPVLLEPVMNVVIDTPEDYAGDLMGRSQ